MNEQIELNVEILVLLCKKHHLQFENHCIRRIAYDNVVKNKWNRLIKSPFVKNATIEQLNAVNKKLINYIDNIQLLISDNKKSLIYRKQ